MEKSGEKWRKVEEIIAIFFLTTEISIPKNLDSHQLSKFF